MWVCVCGVWEFTFSEYAFNGLKILHRCALQEDSVTQRTTSDIMWRARYHDCLAFSSIDCRRRHRHRCHCLCCCSCCGDRCCRQHKIKFNAIFNCCSSRRLQAISMRRAIRCRLHKKKNFFRVWKMGIFVCKRSFCQSMNQSKRRFTQTGSTKKKKLLSSASKRIDFSQSTGEENILIFRTDLERK